MRTEFVLSEIWIGLRRNLTMTIAVVITVAVSLGLIGAGLIVGKQSHRTRDFWYGKVEVSIFLTKNVTDPQRTQIQSQLFANPLVKQVVYESKSEAYKHFKKQFADEPALVNNVTPDALPESFRVKLKDPKQYNVVASQFQGQPGVDQVFDDRKVVQPLFAVLAKFQRGAWFFAIWMVIAAALLIGNTARVAAFNRRRETGIMRLVGASSLYIQLPFILESVVTGLIGAGFAVGVISLIKWWFIDQVLGGEIRKILQPVSWGDVWATAALIIPLGIVLSAASSFVTLRRYLRV